MSGNNNKQQSISKWEGMPQRTVTGAILVGVSIAVVLNARNPIVLKAVTILLSIAAVFELIRAAHLEQERPFLFAMMAAAGIIPLIPIPCYKRFLPWILAAATVVFFHIMGRNARCILDTKPRTGGICLLVILLLRSIPEFSAMKQGSFCLGLSMAICYATDAFAYLGGKAFGTHKLCPDISPNKTVEGSICGILGAAAVALAAAILWDFRMIPLLIYAVSASVAGQFGDLAISGIKRAFAVKDLGNILPGHGGILDRFDSHTFAIPFSLLFFTFRNGLF